MVFKVTNYHKFLNCWFSKAIFAKRLSQLLFQKIKIKIYSFINDILINKIHKRSTIFNLFHFEISHIHHSQFSISFFSHSLSNSSNSSKLHSLRINCTKLNASSQPILGLFNQFLLTKTSFFKFSNYKRHFLRFIKILASEKICSISI